MEMCRRMAVKDPKRVGSKKVWNLILKKDKLKQGIKNFFRLEHKEIYAKDTAIHDNVSIQSSKDLDKC